jgi:hypothetical protein
MTTEFPTQEEVNDFLDATCQSGMVDIYDSAPLVQAIFGITKYDANRYLMNWIEMMEEVTKDTNTEI